MSDILERIFWKKKEREVYHGEPLVVTNQWSSRMLSIHPSQGLNQGTLMSLEKWRLKVFADWDAFINILSSFSVCKVGFGPLTFSAARIDDNWPITGLRIVFKMHVCSCLSSEWESQVLNWSAGDEVVCDRVENGIYFLWINYRGLFVTQCFDFWWDVKVLICKAGIICLWMDLLTPESVYCV